MFEHVPKRDHYPTQIYTHGHDQYQLMARGKAKHEHHSGEGKDIDYAAYYELVDVKGEIRFKKVHVIAVSSANFFVGSELEILVWRRVGWLMILVGFRMRLRMNDLRDLGGRGVFLGLERLVCC